MNHCKDCRFFNRFSKHPEFIFQCEYGKCLKLTQVGPMFTSWHTKLGIEVHEEFGCVLHERETK